MIRGTSEDLNIQDCDPELYDLILKEKHRQVECLELIASENFVSLGVQQCLGSCLTNKYSEGYPGKRYYGGVEYIDQIERLCIQRALNAFNLDPNTWHINVQPLSGSPANLAVLLGLINPHDRIMGLSIADGGHLTHGAYNNAKRLSASSIYYESLNYSTHPETGLIDYEKLRDMARRFQPKIIICGYSAYPRNIDYKEFRKIADECNALLWCDMAHISGLVAAGLLESPFEYSDIVTSTTHKTLRGPRSGVIFINKSRVPEGASKIDSAVFPGLQGGPHQNAIAALALQLHQVMTPEWKSYAEQIIKNAQTLSKALIEKGFTVATGGTDCHLLLVDLKSHGITGSKVQSLCDAVNITLNKNYLAGDNTSGAPSGVRMGSPALTTRGFKEQDFVKVAEFFSEAIEIGKDIQSKITSKKLVDFEEKLHNDERLANLKARVAEYCRPFHMPGYTYI